MNEPEWEAYDPQMAWEWHDWAVERIEELQWQRDEYERLLKQVSKSWGFDFDVERVRAMRNKYDL